MFLCTDRRTELDFDPNCGVPRKQGTLEFLSFYRYYYLLYSTVILLTSALPWLLWDESLKVCIFGVYVFRAVLNYNFTWLVNSAAHLFGNKPYNV